MSKKTTTKAPDLLHAARCALADLEGIMPEFEPSGDREHPGWETIKELKKAIAKATGGGKKTMNNKQKTMLRFLMAIAASNADWIGSDGQTLVDFITEETDEFQYLLDGYCDLPGFENEFGKNVPSAEIIPLLELDAAVYIEYLPECWEEEEELINQDRSVNCYFCASIVDERDCIVADDYNDNDGGVICKTCVDNPMEEKV